MNNILKTNHLTKNFRQQQVLKDVNLTVNHGEIYAFIGRNGAGKTTFMRIVSGLTQQTSGEIHCLGKNQTTDRIDYSQIGVLIETPAAFEQFSAYDNLKMKCLCGNIENPNEHIQHLLEIVHLSDVGKKKVKHFSLGMKQRLGIALALVGNPKFLVLDEPINGLDPQGIVEVRTILQDLASQGISILISSHILEELHKVATNFGIIEDGKLLYQLTKQELDMMCEKEDLTLEEFYLGITGGVHYA